MATSQPQCYDPDCAQLIFVEEDDWDRDAPAFDMGERVCVKTCDACGLEQYVELFVEKSFLTRPMPKPEENEESEDSQT